MLSFCRFLLSCCRPLLTVHACQNGRAGPIAYCILKGSLQQTPSYCVISTQYLNIMNCAADIPLKKAVAGVRVGLLPELGFVVNPTVQQMEESKLDLIMAGTDSAVLMIEGYCDFLTEDQMLEVSFSGTSSCCLGHFSTPCSTCPVALSQSVLLFERGKCRGPDLEC